MLFILIHINLFNDKPFNWSTSFMWCDDEYIDWFIRLVSIYTHTLLHFIQQLGYKWTLIIDFKKNYGRPFKCSNRLPIICQNSNYSLFSNLLVGRRFVKINYAPIQMHIKTHLFPFSLSSRFKYNIFFLHIFLFCVPEVWMTDQ